MDQLLLRVELGEERGRVTHFSRNFLFMLRLLVNFFGGAAGLAGAVAAADDDEEGPAAPLAEDADDVGRDGDMDRAAPSVVDDSGAAAAGEAPALGVAASAAPSAAPLPAPAASADVLLLSASPGPAGEAVAVLAASSGTSLEASSLPAAAEGAAVFVDVPLSASDTVCVLSPAWPCASESCKLAEGDVVA